ncbi:MAG TPA: hypothetical protein VEC15_07340 [Actinomycetota bacterium]|nr:hypothetical protein [Actinomycetota bacterium]
MRRAVFVAMTCLGLAACGDAGGRALTTYYDPEGHFTTSLPSVNSIQVTPPQPAATGPGLLTGVIASPPAPSPAPTAGFGGGMLQQQQAADDQTIYEAFAFTTDTFDDLDAMSLYFLTGDPAIDVDQDDPIRVAGFPGRLIVATVTQDGAPTASIAAALTLGAGGTGYLVAAIFPPGEWDAERDGFLDILDSFEPNVPPGASTFDLGEEPA